MTYLVPARQEHWEIVLENTSFTCPPINLHLESKCTKMTSDFCGVQSEAQTYLSRAHGKV